MSNENFLDKNNILLEANETHESDSLITNNKVDNPISFDLIGKI